MINDKERREIAARLRELADANEGHLGMDRVNRVLREGQAILGTSGLASVADVLRRHADLIDRPTCKNAELMDEPADSLERIADELEVAEGWCDKNGDYDTGIVSISEPKLREWSDRIRKLAKKEKQND